MNKYLQRYLVAVQHPEVSGFELLDMLTVRDRLATQVEPLAAEEKQMLTVADQQLILHASTICNELAHVTDLAYERSQRNPTAEQWWWFLDILVTAPVKAQRIDVSMVAA